MENLKKARLAKKMTQLELASKINVKNTTISNWEKGVSQPDNNSLKKLSKILEVSIDYLVGRSDDPKRH